MHRLKRQIRHLPFPWKDRPVTFHWWISRMAKNYSSGKTFCFAKCLKGIATSSLRCGRAIRLISLPLRLRPERLRIYPSLPEEAQCNGEIRSLFKVNFQMTRLMPMWWIRLECLSIIHWNRRCVLVPLIFSRMVRLRRYAHGMAMSGLFPISMKNWTRYLGNVSPPDFMNPSG